MTITPETNFEYGVDAHVGIHRPAGFCFTLAHALPLPPRGGTQGDSLFIAVGGIPRDAVC